MQDDATAWAWPWWTVMVLINAVNLVLCVRLVLRTAGSVDDPDWKYRTWMRTLGVAFTLVAAYRSVFVCRYSTQMAWFDTLANSSLLIRGFALLAEVSFSGQFALALIQANRDLCAEPTDPMARRFARRAPYVLWGCISLAQVFATTGVITKSELAFAIEETLWFIGFATVLPLAVRQLRRASAMRDSGRFEPIRRFAILQVLWCAVYCTWSGCLNLPIAWAAAVRQIRTGVPEIRHGWSAVRDALLVVHESKAWSDWGFGFVFWHSSYFSVCVWLSLFLMTAPRARQEGPDRGTVRPISR
ncbi:MAG TPA: hypothetical protein VHT91_14085 [Kofleriaceae bacterium]|jgi:hypothetical protein|nr:hypothetical protein [Kofleriaceae bacterium]